mmetsp:Transcript_34668/g.68243  ORF Transcript_34668/g.68243 Transcript_34668/m.68243 type:complete len:128 (-) Transcript_34668:39-422(-)
MAATALQRSFSVPCGSVHKCVRLTDHLAPGHPEIHTADATKVGTSCRKHGGAIVGGYPTQELGDDGLGPHHTRQYDGGLVAGDFRRSGTLKRASDKQAAQNLPHHWVLAASGRSIWTHLSPVSQDKK